MDSPIDILLVDDEPRNLDALEATLTDPSYRLLRAQDADRALRLLLEHDVAAIVLDIKMPQVNGIELAQMIKGTKRFRQIPILFLTAHLVDDTDVLTGYGVGAVDYVTKPFNPEILRHKVAVFAELFRKTRALAELNDRLEQRVQERTAELERSEKALRLAAQQKDEFLATLAHELRNPLAPLRTGVGLLTQVLAPPAPVVAKTLAAMNRQIDHLVRLIDDLLDISRISRGVLELKKERSDLGAIVTSTVETFQSVLEKRRLALTVKAADRIVADVDRIRLSQILGNLLHNASKFTPPGGQVRIDLEHTDHTAVVRVSDTGVGIPKEQIEHVFEMFARIERVSSPADHGAGIGLALAKRLAQMHGGDITAASPGEGRGTTFTLTLPGAEVGARTADVDETPRSVPPKDGGRALDVLVIEDNPDVADVLVAWLEELGHRVSIARTGPQGLAMAQRQQPRVILCDLGLPEMDGVEVCRRLRASGNEVRPLMIAVTGWGKPEDRARTAAAGFDYHLVKPVSLDALQELLSAASAEA